MTPHPTPSHGMTLKEICEQLKSCGFTCEAGNIEHNTAFIELERRAGSDGDYLIVQATIQFTIHKYGFMDDKRGIFKNASDKELLDYCIENFEGHCHSVDGDAIEIGIIRRDP